MLCGPEQTTYSTPAPPMFMLQDYRTCCSADHRSEPGSRDRFRDLVPSLEWWEFSDGVLHNCKLAHQAGASCLPNVRQPSTFRNLICPESSKPQNSMAGVSAKGRTVCVLMRRLNS